MPTHVLFLSAHIHTHTSPTILVTERKILQTTNEKSYQYWKEAHLNIYLLVA